MCQAAIRKRKTPWIVTIMRPKTFSGRLLEWQPTCLSYSWRGTMHLQRTRVFDGQEVTSLEKAFLDKTSMDKSDRARRQPTGGKLRAFAAMMLTMASCMPSGMAAQTPA